jgi:hypothetical protein
MSKQITEIYLSASIWHYYNFLHLEIGARSTSRKVAGTIPDEVYGNFFN